jgi:hypothetical protein
MENGAAMTPAEYLARMDELFAACDDEGALALATQWGPTVHPQLSAEELVTLLGTLEGCQMAVNLEAWEQAHAAERPA